MSLLSTDVKRQTSFYLLTDRLMPSVSNRLLFVDSILLRQLFFVAAVVYHVLVMAFFIWPT